MRRQRLYKGHNGQTMYFSSEDSTFLHPESYLLAVNSLYYRGGSQYKLTESNHPMYHLVMPCNVPSTNALYIHHY